ncbi:MBOAT family protein [Belliella sp. R4-6]|uniref:MBOAT family protein n=1 Tax=Belliella alkalica TaxID=1730871 RepID=A0ABS9V7I3_9BACT|nr:MBOAT family O-acyltransferase [Belliella alkalica]MCH7412383.1 MBOAT family protein [Belliella alkalica]
MLFNSIEFLLFLPLVFFLYWSINRDNIRLQNILLLVASYVFYGWWDWRFLGLIFVNSVIDFICGLQIEKSKARKKHFLVFSIISNLGMLGFFKYFNFFINSTVAVLESIGVSPNQTSLQIILPVGISFYTFQTLSYTIDVYNEKIKATKDPIAFFTFVSFFPQLVAGPIERASNLLPQFFTKKLFDYQQASFGMKLILWGLFKKMVIADNCAKIVDPIFDNIDSAAGFELIVGVFLFSFQIYGDFSGYSDIAIGVASLLGFQLMTNFKTPYFSRDIAEFWRRWHISLSTWFRDYVYIPLGGSRVKSSHAIRNIFIVFILSGFWHGANWTFVAWGGLHAIFFIPLFVSKKNRVYTSENQSLVPSINEVFQILLTFCLVSLSWVFFRSDTISDAFNYFYGVLINPFLPHNFSFFGYEIRLLIIIFLILEWMGNGKYNWMERIENNKYRKIIYVLVAFIIVFFGSFTENMDFIYFQF